MLDKMISSQRAIEYSISSSDYRQHTRYTNNIGTVVEIDFLSKKQLFNNSIKGLVINDSLGGCSLMVVTPECFEANQICLMRTEGVSPIKIKIIWIEELETNIFRLGIEYLTLLDSDEVSLC